MYGAGPRRRGVAQELLGAGNAVGVLSNIPVGLGRMVRERNGS